MGVFVYIFGFLIYSIVVHHVVSENILCGHQRAPVENLLHNIPSVEESSRLRRAAGPIRITPYFDKTVLDLSVADRSVVENTIIPTITEFLNDVLQVKQPSLERILYKRSCTGDQTFTVNGSTSTYCISPGQCAAEITCGPATVPSNHLNSCQGCTTSSVDTCSEVFPSGAGVPNTDFIMYVAASSADPCGDGTGGSEIIAYASACRMDPNTDRPVAGYINLCPSALSNSNLKETAKHEILHAIGFSSSLIPFWRDMDGNARTSRVSSGFPPSSDGRFVADGSTLMTVTRSPWKVYNGETTQEVTYLITENVREEARDHFGCPSLPGLELENQGNVATLGSHWEKRILENEAMTGVLTQNPVFSRLTLAALQDSGWYNVDYQYAQALRFGKGLGCDFVQSSCLSWIEENNSPAPFCNVPESLRTSCTPDRRSVGTCNLITHTTTLPLAYQYFANRMQGGRVQLADFCPFIKELLYEGGRTTACERDSNQPTPRTGNLFAEQYGSSSRCIVHGTSKDWSINSQTFPSRGGSGCYQYDCSTDPEVGVMVTIEGVVLNCSCEGKEITFVITAPDGTDYTGSIICPACSDICWDNLSMCPTNPLPACPGEVEDVIGAAVSATSQSVIFTVFCLLAIAAINLYE